MKNHKIRAFILNSSLCVLHSAFISSCQHPASSIHDDLGRSVNLPSQIRRVVTLAPNLTEIVFAAGAGEKVVCTDDYSDFPPEAKKLPKVGGLQPNIERIVACRPDVVFATTNGNHPALAPALTAVRIPLFVVRTDRLEEIPATIERLGALLQARRASDTGRQLRMQIEAQRRTRARSPRVLFAVWTNPLYVAGKKTFADDLLSLTGATNVVAVDGWPQYSLESMLAEPPDLLIYPQGSVTPAAVEALYRAAPELRGTTTAVGVDENRFTRPGPRVAQAAAELNAILDRWSMLRK
jgi:iron complex transport system substrate-binding protein